MIINMGPQHPSTHGVLRLMLELDGETVLRTKPVIGYLHTGMEKTGEALTYLQGPTNVTRMDYASPLFNELVFSLAVESCSASRMLPPRATWIRMLHVRAQPHVVAPAVPGHQRHGPRRGVDDALRLARARGDAALLREDHRPADEPQLHPPRRRRRRPARRLARRRAARCSTSCPPRLDEYDDAAHRPADLARAAPGRRRHHHRGGARPRRHRPDPALHRLRRGTCAGTCRTSPTTRSTSTSSSAPTATASTATPSGSTRSASRCTIVRQFLDTMPAGDYRVQDKKVTPPPRARIDESMEALIHHFKLFTEGFKVPEGEAYVAVESPAGRARLLPRVRRQRPSPYRMHIRGPSLRQPPDAAAHDARRPHRRRGRHHLLRRPDHGRGRPLSWPASTRPSNRARPGDHRPLPAPDVGAHPAAAPRPGAGRLGHRRGDGAHRRAGRPHAGRGARHVRVLRDVQARAGGPLPRDVCTNISCLLIGGDELLDHAEEPLGMKAGSTTRRRLFTLEEVECIAACTEAPCLQVNYRYFHGSRTTTSTSWSTTCAPGGSTTRSRRTARWPGSASTSPATAAAGAAAPDGDAEPAWMAAPAPAPREARRDRPGHAIPQIVTRRFGTTDAHTLDALPRAPAATRACARRSA